MTEKMKILIGYDGTKGADLALDDLRRAGLLREAEVLVLSIVEPSFVLSGPGSLEMIIARDSIFGTGFPRAATKSSAQTHRLAFARSGLADLCRGG
jgi:nucleotide-binding universal stress UspA family protein